MTHSFPTRRSSHLHPTLDVRLLLQELEVGEQHLDHAGGVDEVGNVGLGHRAADGPEGLAERKILVEKAEPYSFHACFTPGCFPLVRPSPFETVAGAISSG